MSPIPLFRNDSEAGGAIPWNEPSMPATTNTPPHHRLMSLRLLGSPQTPKVLVQKSQRRTLREDPQTPNVLAQKSQRRTIREVTRPRQLIPELPGKSESNDNPSIDAAEGFNRLHSHFIDTMKRAPCVSRLNRSTSRKILDPTGLQANVNPFAHLSTGLQSAKRGRNSMER